MSQKITEFKSLINKTITPRSDCESYTQIKNHDLITRKESTKECKSFLIEFIDNVLELIEKKYIKAISYNDDLDTTKILMNDGYITYSEKDDKILYLILGDLSKSLTFKKNNFIEYFEKNKNRVYDLTIYN